MRKKSNIALLRIYNESVKNYRDVSVDRPGVLIALLLLGSIAVASAANDGTAARVERFLSALEGDWLGNAEITPIGPRPYDISFERGQNNRVEGSSGIDTIHHWSFYRQEGDLQIRFLSTFGGNRKPIFLYASQWTDRDVMFRAKDPQLLSVRVSIPDGRLSIDVYHWDQPHVSIRLTRSH